MCRELGSVPILSEKTRNKHIRGEVSSWVVAFVTRIVNCLTLAFIKEIQIVYDTDMGYNIIGNTRGIFPFKKGEIHWQYAALQNQLDQEWEILCDMGFKLMLYFWYNDDSCTIKLQSKDVETGKGELSLSNRDINSMVEDNYIGTICDIGGNLT